LALNIERENKKLLIEEKDLIKELLTNLIFGHIEVSLKRN